MRSAWADFTAYFKRHPVVAGIMGFFSIFVVWALPSYAIRWNEWFSFAYVYGDHLVLPLFNAISFWLLAKNTGKIQKLAIAAPILLAVLFVVFFEPDASSFLKSGSVDSLSEAYHSGFVALEFSFILFMCGVYPFLRGTYAPLIRMLVLVLLIETFLAFVNIPDARLNDLSLLERVAPPALLAASYIALIVRRTHSIFSLPNGNVSPPAESERESEETPPASN